MEQKQKASGAFSLDLGILDTEFPGHEVDGILAELNRAEKRVKKLPSRMVVYLVIALGLISSVGSRQVLRHMLDRVRERRRFRAPLASEAAITQARRRVGVEPLKVLFEQFVRPMAPKWVAAGWFKSWRVVSIDGTTVRVLDTDANEARFGRPKAARGTTAYPQLRLVGLLENGTRIMFGVALGAYHVAENVLARAVLGGLGPEMLCLADRGFFGYQLWDQAVQTGAALLWRVKSTLKLQVLERLPDGSYRSQLRSPDRRTREVRVITFTLTFSNGKTTHYRLITTILDPNLAPARELAQLYASRWTIETMFDELKVRLGGPKFVLRSGSPDLVEQDVYGLLLAHFGVRHEMLLAARPTHADPTEFSFTNTLAIIIRWLPQMCSFSPSAEAALP